MNSRNPRVGVAVIIIAVLVVGVAFAYPFFITPVQVQAGCDNIPAAQASATPDPKLVNGVAQPLLGITTSLATAAVSEQTTVAISLFSPPANLGQTVMAGFEVRLSKSVSESAVGASGITVYRSAFQPLKEQGGALKTEFIWTIPAMPAGNYNLVPVLENTTVAALSPQSLRPKPAQMTIQSAIGSFAWIDGRNAKMATDGTFTSSIANTTGLAGKVSLTAQLYLMGTIHGTPAQTLTSDVSFADTEGQKSFSLKFNPVQSTDSPVVVIVANFGKYSQTLTSVLGSTGPRILTALVQKSSQFLRETSSANACFDRTGLTKLSAVVHWFRGDSQVGSSQTALPEQGDGPAEAGLTVSKRYFRGMQPDRVEVQLLQDGHIVDTLSVTPSL